MRDAAQETGFLRCQEDGSVELLLTHNTGFLELWHGKVDGAKLDLTTDAVIRTETAKEVTAGHRLYGLVEGDLWFAYDMAAQGRHCSPTCGASSSVSDGVEPTTVTEPVEIAS